MGSTKTCQFIDLNPQAQPHKLLFAQTVSRCVATERKIETINKEYARNDMEQQGPRSLRDLEECIRCIARDKQKNQNMLFETIEADVTSKLQFIEGQMVQLRSMEQELGSLVELREVLEQT